MPNIGDFVYFSLIYDFLNQKVEQVGLDLMNRMMTWASVIALTLVTLWVLIQGYRMMTGQSRESMMHVVANAAKIALIVTAATTMSFVGRDLHQYLTVDLGKEINSLFTGDDTSPQDAIDKNLALTQLALSAIDSVDVVKGDEEALADKTKAQLIAGFGQASPPMAAGAMLLLYQFTMAIFIGLGPLFILCLIFDQTKELFRRWLLYGIGTLFSMAALNVVMSIALDVTSRVAGALFVDKIASGFLDIGTSGLTSEAMQTGGIGLLMTVLIISVPPLAAMFFQGTAGNFMTYSAWQGNNRPGAGGQPPGSYGGSHTSRSNQQSNDRDFGSSSTTAQLNANRVVGNTPPPSQDVIRKQSS
ncbi:MAG TPA: type IV secretion system protein [Dyella sp.]|uniref:type IV secretion system protein n=1 Tax=Dyella sp. TaxID=1869338 RepID=UPI002F94877C